ncbi:hypothetical protein BOX15_Mlig026520g2, partial [Macrostomum lignano]
DQEVTIAITAAVFSTYFCKETGQLDRRWLHEVVFPQLREINEFGIFHVNKEIIRTSLRRKGSNSYLLRLVCAESAGCKTVITLSMADLPLIDSVNLRLQKKNEHSGHRVILPNDNVRHLWEHGSQECREFVASKAACKDARPTEIYEGSLQHFKSGKICSLASVRQACSRIQNASRRSQNEHEDLRKQMLDWKISLVSEDAVSGFIQRISTAPFGVVIYCAEQQFLLRQLLARNPYAPVHIDATGGLVRKSELIPENVLLCSAVVSSESESVVATPIAEAVLESTKTEDISAWIESFLLNFARFQDRGVWEVSKVGPRIYVIDFSWVFLHGVLRAAAIMDLGTYLRKQFKRLTSWDVKPPSYPLVFICSSHLMHRVAMTIAIKNRETKKNFLIFFANLITADSLETAKSVWETMLRLFCSQYVTSVVQDAFEVLHQYKASLPSSCHEFVNEMPDPEEENQSGISVDPPDSEAATTLRSSSPFSGIFGVPEPINTEAKELNPNFSLEAMQKVFKLYLPLLPIWSVCVFKGTPISTHLTNAPVESWFRWVKARVRRKSGTRLLIGNFLRAQLECVLERISRVKKNQQTVLPPRRPRRRKVNEEAPHVPKGDPWASRVSKPSYLGGKIASKLPFKCSQLRPARKSEHRFAPKSETPTCALSPPATLSKNTFITVKADNCGEEIKSVYRGCVFIRRDCAKTEIGQECAATTENG